MKLSNIQQLLNKILPVNTFKEKISNEVELYKQSLKVKGKSASIHLTEDINNIKVGVENVKYLCTIFLEGRIDNLILNYIVESLLLSDKVMFENEIVEEALNNLTDPELGLKLSYDYIKKIQDTLN